MTAETVKAEIQARGRDLTTGEAAIILNVSRSNVNRLASARVLTAHRVSHAGHWRVSVASLEQFSVLTGCPLNWDRLETLGHFE